ncbi:FxSxx-COOH system tetratricopeptide repeat protein [Actinoplanes auranticolor]|uniref:NB-ARC domain-containing protein n=1 Tax=Actinoplanes auranticolor TaxID=47988 RepID=A0A919SV35_9ACTN|nr:FxSxx-COOH system tetratricopeptide repeat protein [Actinoplanes auranticolor]GIM77583.1 hypothetical protein Aau02nite_76560 [Actinoplanes auranticolor]
MTAATLAAYPAPGSGPAELAVLLSTAVQIEPELIRAVRLACAPGRDVGAEGDLWFSDWVGVRSADAVRLRGELLPDLRNRLVARLAADRRDPAWRVRETVAAVHAGRSPALRLEERITWAAVSRAAGDPDAEDAEELLRSAVRAAVEPGRAGVAGWFGAAFRRLPSSVQQTVPAWQLLQTTDAAGSTTAPEDLPLDLADVAALGDRVADTTVRVRHDGWDLTFNYTGSAPAQVLSVPDTRPRILQVRWGSGRQRQQRILRVEPDRPTTVEVGGAPVRVQTGRGSVYLLEPATHTAVATGTAPGPAAVGRGELIWGGVPARNSHLRGRPNLLAVLHDELLHRSTVVLQGMAGVGKTQLAIEYTYRHQEEYQLVWWVPAEQVQAVRRSLNSLAQRLGLPPSDDINETTRTVLDWLVTADMPWLLVYDNAASFDDIGELLPSGGGHVIITTRNPAFRSQHHVIEVDVMTRAESIDLLLRRMNTDGGDHTISTGDADRLAERLGDLPLALEQAAAYLDATATPATEYINLLEEHQHELLSEGKPASYPATVSATVQLALEQLRSQNPASVQLFQLFGFLGSEPVSLSLLRRGARGRVTPPLGRMLINQIDLNRAVRDLSRHGLAKIDAGQRVQVHRLVQAILRDAMSPEEAERTLKDVQAILSAANPGDPDEVGDFERQAELGPHIQPANLVGASDPDARQVVLDHARYLYLIGEYENSRAIAEGAASAWERTFGRDAENTLRARSIQSAALRALGDGPGAAALTRETYELSRARLGAEHEFPLLLSLQVGHDLRIAGQWQEALDLDRGAVEACRVVFGDSVYTRRAEGNLATDLRLLGFHTEALRLDGERGLPAREGARGPAADARRVAAQLDIAQDTYAAGDYTTMLRVVEQWRPTVVQLHGARHPLSMIAGRLTAIALRKLGRHAEAADTAREAALGAEARFGPDNELTLATRVTLANAYRQIGDLDEAQRIFTDTINRYRVVFGDMHPFTLIARHNMAIVHRARGDVTTASAVDRLCYNQFRIGLPNGHHYMRSSAASLATDLALTGETTEAAALSRLAVELDRDDWDHPDALLRVVNLARDTGSDESAALHGLAAQLGDHHPDVTRLREGGRAELDIEPLPT